MDKRSLCSLSVDDLEGDINLSDDEDAAKIFRNEARQKRGNRKEEHIRQEIDTNIFRIELSTLKNS